MDRARAAPRGAGHRLADGTHSTVRDAGEVMDSIYAAGRLPLLVGGTMLYFRALTGGMADLPSASAEIRDSIDAEARRLGWPALHERLRELDPDAAARIEPRDRQRIQRALEVYLASGETITSLQAQGGDAGPDDRFLMLALYPADRARLHARIEQRLETMVAAGFPDEVRTLMARPGLERDSPAMRAVGYRQIRQYLDDNYAYDVMVERGLAATRQLAKRQLTWLKRWPDLQRFSFENEKIDKKVQIILNFLQTKSI